VDREPWFTSQVCTGACLPYDLAFRNVLQFAANRLTIKSPGGVGLCSYEESSNKLSHDGSEWNAAQVPKFCPRSILSVLTRAWYRLEHQSEAYLGKANGQSGDAWNTGDVWFQLATSLT
jgi:hypothetical protein